MAQPQNLLLRQKYHQYKIYTPAGVYLGLLQNVTTPFQYNQPIATAFVQLQITVGQTADVADQAVTPITDEAGNPITDEAGNNLLIERQPDVVGSSNSNALIANDNIIVVVEYSNYYPNGLVKFTGYISKWKATFGASNDILITCISNGQDLVNYPVQGTPIQDQAQTNTDGNTTINNLTSTSFQIITPGASTTTLNRITLQLASVIANNPTLTVNLYASSSSGILNLSSALSANPPDATASAVVASTSPTNYDFIFNYTYPNGTPGYFIIILTTTDTNGVKLYYQDGSPYAGGNLFNGKGLFPFDGTCSLYFKTFYSSSTINAAYVNDDPSFVMNDLVTNYNKLGGSITVPVGGYSNTNTLATYTFKMQTILQAIQATVALAPANWYWYVDPATGVLQFAKANTVADITIIRKRHINEIDIEATKENIKNTAYFTGGDDGTATSTNILVKVSKALGGNRVGLALLSDNRVNSATGGTVTAKLIAQNYLNVNNSEQYIANAIIQDQTMDINLLKLGLMVGFSGFGNFVDNLLLQIVGVNYQSDQAILQLGTLPKRDTAVVAAIQAGLQYAQTVANPSTPS